MIHGMWLTEQMGLAGTAYHMPLPIWFDDELDRDRLIRACQAVVARHPILSCAFRDGVPVPAVNQPVVELASYSDVSAQREERSAAEHRSSGAHDLVTKPFDLAGGPLIRFTLAGNMLLVVAHHLVFDGQSKDILVRELAAVYNGQELPPLPSRPPSAVEVEPVTWVEPDAPILPYSHHARGAQPGECDRFTINDLSTSDNMTRFETVFAGLVRVLRTYGNTAPVVSVNLGTRVVDCHIGCYVNEVPVIVSGDPRAALHEAYALRHIPFARTVTGVTPRAALTPVSISYRRRAATPSFDGLDVRADFNAFHHSARNALHVQVVDDGSTLDIRVDHPVGTPSVATHLRNVLTGQPLLSGDDLATLLARGSGPVVSPAGLAPDLIAAQPPDAIAIAVADHSVTYGTLEAGARELAERLRRAGVQPGHRVAVSLGRTPDLLTALLGVWYAGAAYVPVDPAYPPARREQLLTDSAPAALITVDGVIPLTGAELGEPGTAYVIHTSGSTGRPKGVSVSHAAVANLLQAMGDMFGTTAWLATSAYSFDMSIPELWLPLVNGGTVVLAEDARDGAELLKLLQSRRATHVHATPSTWRLLLDAGFDEPSVTAIAGADVLPQPLADEIRARSAALWNMYGPTETTVWSTGGLIDGEVSIGRPLANTQVYLLDGCGELVPDGIPGELCIGGAGLARGYLHQPPFEGLYHTGDRARWRGDRLEFLGRNDNQVKLRGYRVELGEVEAALAAVTNANAAAAIHGDTLVGYVTAPCDKAQLAKLLPSYMVPSIVVGLDRLPLTPNGKLDRAALPAPTFAAVEKPVYEGLAAQVYEIWREVLKRDDIGPDDSLFDLGGHSLTVTQISLRMRKRLGIDLPLHIFFDSPTIAGIVAAS